MYERAQHHNETAHSQWQMSDFIKDLHGASHALRLAAAINKTDKIDSFQAVRACKGTHRKTHQLIG